MDKLKNSPKRSFKNAVIPIIFFTILLYISSLLFHVVEDEDSFTPSKSDAIMVLGHSLEDGSIPGDWLVLRLEEGLRLYEEGYGSYIIGTGGEGPWDKKPVADSMKEWLIEKGVSEDTVITEPMASNTYENFKYSSEISEENHINSIVIVTNDFHMYRSMLIGSRFYENISGSGAEVPMSFRKLLAYLKEPLSIIKYNLLY